MPKRPLDCCRQVKMEYYVCYTSVKHLVDPNLVHQNTLNTWGGKLSMEQLGKGLIIPKFQGSDPWCLDSSGCGSLKMQCVLPLFCDPQLVNGSKSDGVMAVHNQSEG